MNIKLQDWRCTDTCTLTQIKHENTRVCLKTLFMPLMSSCKKKTERLTSLS